MIFCDNPECPLHIDVAFNRYGLYAQSGDVYSPKKYYTRHQYVLEGNKQVLWFCNVCKGAIIVRDELYYRLIQLEKQKEKIIS